MSNPVQSFANELTGVSLLFPRKLTCKSIQIGCKVLKIKATTILDSGGKLDLVKMKIRGMIYIRGLSFKASCINEWWQFEHYHIAMAPNILNVASSSKETEVDDFMNIFLK